MKFGVVLDIGESIDDVQLTKKNKKFCVARNERACSGGVSGNHYEGEKKIEKISQSFFFTFSRTPDPKNP